MYVSPAAKFSKLLEMIGRKAMGAKALRCYVSPAAKPANRRKRRDAKLRGLTVTPEIYRASEKMNENKNFQGSRKIPTKWIFGKEGDARERAYVFALLAKTELSGLCDDVCQPGRRTLCIRKKQRKDERKKWKILKR